LLSGQLRRFRFDVRTGGCLAYHCWSRNAQILDFVNVSDNLSPAFSGFSRLSGPVVVRFSGADTHAFAQAQFSNDLRPLTDGQWQWSSWLTAKGRVISVFQLLRIDDQQLLAIFHDGDGANVAEALRRFVFRRKVSIAVEADWAISARFAAPTDARSDTFHTYPTGMLELDQGSAALPRTLRLEATSEIQPFAAQEQDAFALAWRQADLRLGLPRLDASQVEVWTPQQLGLDRLNAVSVKKGCYPGQEIVARTHFLGKAKRSLQLLACSHAVAPGTQVSCNGNAIGTVASSAGPLALAVLPLEIPEGELLVDGYPAARDALIEGLAR
jgi:folate-binding protein YgfZ